MQGHAAIDQVTAPHEFVDTVQDHGPLGLDDAALLRNESGITSRIGNAGTARKSPPWALPGLRSVSGGRFAFSSSRANLGRNTDTPRSSRCQATLELT